MASKTNENNSSTRANTALGVLQEAHLHLNLARCGEDFLFPLPSLTR
jgi:hypothetical protein